MSKKEAKKYGRGKHMKKIGFIGIGIMGKSMVRNLMKAGYEVAVYSRTRSKAEDVISEGAVWCEDVKACSKGRDAVISIVGYPKDVEEVYFGENGIIANADKGTCLIDMTTTSPKLAVRIYEEAKQAGLKALDAPVTGGDTGAREGTLTILAGGDKDTYDRCLPVFEAMGKAIQYEGKAGNGQHTKMCNQIAIAGALSGVCEAMAYAKANGLDVGTMVDSIATGAAGSAQLNAMAPRILSGDFAPGFFIKHFIKDMKLAAEEAEDAGIRLGVLDYVLSMYETMAASGHEDEGTQALVKYYQW
ncbi:MAG: NAD(P)-dependent oxidoreductase [Hungatella sp.]|nr:NAD(P)-dependent oxidoreductase [Hungatella sp.]